MNEQEMIEQELTTTEVDDLYRRVVMPIGWTSGVPIWKAKKLFGPEAVDLVLAFDRGGAYHGLMNIGTGPVKYLNREGFRYAAGYRNLQLLAPKQGGPQDEQ